MPTYTTYGAKVIASRLSRPKKDKTKNIVPGKRISIWRLLRRTLHL